MLGTRLLSGFSLIAVLLGVLVLDEVFAPWYPLWLLLSCTVLLLAALELAELLRGAGLDPSRNTILGGCLALILANWLPHLSDRLFAPEPTPPAALDPADPIALLSWPLLTFAGVLMVSFVVQSVQFVKPGRTVATLASSLFVLAYVGLLGSFIIQFRWLDGPYHGIPPLVLLVATAKGADTGAYTLGRLAGRHKLWPSLSPNKTIEGALGGMLFAVLASLIVTAVARHLFVISFLSWPEAVAFGLLIGLAAQLGDLMESMIKRDCERKDASSAVPGFGGVLDVVDSLLFAGPVAYGFWVCAGR